ncbi:MAG: TIGR03790 family protein [Candidatus Brocadiia bacterium]|jgi:uncharacterized protein (TIGR03790 family)
MKAHWARMTTAAFLLTSALALAPARLAMAANGEWDHFPQLGRDDFLSNVITAVARDSRGRIWAGTDRGLAWTDDGGKSWTRVELAEAQPRLSGRRRAPDTAAAPAPAGEQAILRNTVTCIIPGRGGIWVGTLNGLCFASEDLTQWDLCGWDSGGPGSEIRAVAEYLGEVWVSSSSGLYKSSNQGDQWDRLKGVFPPNISSITLGEGPSGRACWLGGFDAAVQYGGAPDVLRSADGGKTWVVLKTGTASAVGHAVSARVHGIILEGKRLWAATSHGLAQSTDGGDTWTTVSVGSGLGADETFDLAASESGLWIATSEGLFLSADHGATWRHEGNISCPVRLLARDGRQLWMATGGGLICRTRGGDFKTFSVRSNVLSIAVTKDSDVETWWVGTTGGLASSRDGGKTWRTLSVADGLPSNVILTLAAEGDQLWAGTDGGVCQAIEGGEDWRCYSRQNGLHGLTIHDLLLDKGNVWAATNRGLSLLRPRASEWRSFQVTKEWHHLCLAGDNLCAAVSDPQDPARGFSVILGNPEQEKWRTLRIQGHHGLPVHEIMTAGDDLWVGSDSGLFRSRDAGQTWARFAAESLWSSRVTQLACIEPNLVCAQATPNDPPSTTAFLNFTRDGGRSWLVLPTATPGRATAVKLIGDRILVGTVQAQLGSLLTRGGLAAYSPFEADLRPARTGWLTWNRIAGFAASTYRTDRLGWVSAVDHFALHGPTVWFGSLGSGVIERGVPIMDDVFRSWDVTGVAPLDIGPFATLNGQDVLAIADSPDGVWFGTATGLFLYDRLGQGRSWHPAAGGLCAAPVRAIAVRGNEAWVGTDQGLSVLDLSNATWRTFAVGQSPLPNNGVTALASDGERIWGGTAHGAFVVDQAGNWRPLLEDERISSLALGAAREYFGTDWGVYALDRDGMTRRHLDKVHSSLPDNNVGQVFVDGPDIWAATPVGVGKILSDPAEPQPSAEAAASSRGPEGVLLVVNDNSDVSQKIGEKYAALRKLPPENVCHIRCTADETMARAAFEEDVQAPIRTYLAVKKISRAISFIVTTTGVPLRIAPGAVRGGVARPGTAVDSELTLLAQPRTLSGQFENPYLNRDEPFNSTLFGMYLVTRLDGPSVQEDALAPGRELSLVRDAMAVEKDHSFGARGFARFSDLPFEDENSASINSAIRVNYRALAKLDRLIGRVVPPVKDSPPFFRPDQAVNTFFFLGAGVGEYKPEVFSWVKGALAVNLDRVSASSLRDRKASWVAAALGAGACAAIGNVADPGPDGVPVVANLFHSMKADSTWAETAYMCIPYLCGQTIVIGDPLYTPLK